MKKPLWLLPLFASLMAFEAVAQSQQNVEILDFGNNGSYPFSDASRVGNLLFLSGALGIVPGQDELVPGGIRAETRQVMENIKADTKASGYQMNNIIKCTVFLADMSEWAAFNEVYATYFSKPYPARSAVAVRGLAADARVEVECIAAK
ncbi:reactive intermediate/imine deaminase [Pseudomonas gingeri NCPPB 3146 = LMG 5327]|uniref:RidA family protein n=2 Tax=Pseudomonas gingeri TaxID=117681 RepID=A0A7Y7Y4W3_9PSED|nr:Rid family detoxifying hydrolase [Pseudomonas gingeri]NWC17719.1 RidA family protein [Pseudomonas gingeri]PNQ93656.1 reactive intermediate/imine deaminase [Pseudomonas gingeri NCPPB 3146 = LMG 5327]